ncbi:HAD family hydrolase [Bacillus sp. HMF5848]|uniref:HAD family hydrolase n=1 Tax=Bacillus sp. HMF5848 TaxID=2495421 RepID=UPI000F799F95|nr:HAD family hydrolase [Bacillus sp. HMF5848]RSK29221.1 HAD family hydrolase [Bacillus sp. HMF5848]
MKAIVFDFDGLIIDTESLWYEAYNELLQEYDMDLPMEVFTACIGSTDEPFITYYESHPRKQLEYVELSKLAGKLHKEKAKHLELREGVLDYLHDAKRLGLKIGLASSSSWVNIEHYLRRFDIYDYFDAFRTKDDVERVKPDPALYVKAVEALGVEPHEAVAFEDSLNGLVAARKAGLHGVIVPNAVTAELPFTDYALRLSSMKAKSLEEVINSL